LRQSHAALLVSGDRGFYDLLENFHGFLSPRYIHIPLLAWIRSLGMQDASCKAADVQQASDPVLLICQRL
jgi:hypothetical protein